MVFQSAVKSNYFPRLEKLRTSVSQDQSGYKILILLRIREKGNVKREVAILEFGEGVGGEGLVTSGRCLGNCNMRKIIKSLVNMI